MATTAPTAPTTALDAKISRSPGKVGMIIFGIVLIIGFVYAGSHLLGDLSTMHSESALPFLLRNLALAWVLTLPVAMVLSGSLFLLFRKIF